MEDSLHIPYDRWTDREKAYWSDFCTCRHTRLDHLPRGALRRGRCLNCSKGQHHSFVLEETWDAFSKRTAEESEAYGRALFAKHGTPWPEPAED